MMEHRLQPRCLLSHEVLLYRHGLPVAFVKALNLSMGGMLVQAEREADFSTNAVFELEISPSIHGEQHRYRIPAIIVHCETGRVGFALDTSDEETREALRALMGDKSAKETAHETRPKMR